MYVTAHWVQAFNKDLGTNIYAHRGLGNINQLRTAADAEQIVVEPGPRDEALTRQPLAPRMNRVLAYVDVVLDERHDKMPVADRIRRALNGHELRSNEWSEQDGVFVRFFVQPYLTAREDTYDMLRAQLDRWLNDHFPPLMATG